MPSCIGHGTDPCRCFDTLSLAIKAEPAFLFIDDKPCVTGEAIKAGTEVIIKDGKLYARPATELEKMTTRRDELLAALAERNERVETLSERLRLTERARDSYSGQLSAALRTIRDLEARNGR